MSSPGKPTNKSSEASEENDVKARSESAAGAAPAAAASPPPPPRTLSRIILENTQFLSSVVIGGAGLIATSLYQWNNSKLAQRQAQWQQDREVEKAKNDWRIERAKILAQNLQTLTARGGDTVEQRYGVLLSLTRGNILDPDLAVSYALELGKDSPEYMRSVLGNIDAKDSHHYQRLASAYLPTCTQRFGVTVPALSFCKDDALAERSQAIAEVVADDLDEALTETKSGGGPLALLVDERAVHANLLRMLGVFSEFVSNAYERRQWPTLDRFLSYSTGARIVGSFNLLMESTELVTSADVEMTRQKFEQSRSWLVGYMAGPSCDSECRGRMMSIVLSHLERGQGQFPILMRQLLQRPRAELVPFLNRLRSRLSLCQIDHHQTQLLRDKVLIPVLLGHAEQPAPDQALLDELLGQLEFLPLPPDASADWKKAQAALSRVTQGRQPKQFFERHAEQVRLRKAAAQPPVPAAPAGRSTKSVPVPAAPPPTVAHQTKSFCPFSNQFQDDSEPSED